jgi:hypothetical protein
MVGSTGELLFSPLIPSWELRSFSSAIVVVVAKRKMSDE